MKTKNKIIKIIERFEFISSLYFRIYNQITGDRNGLDLKGVRIKKNKIFNNGNGNKITGGQKNVICNNIIRVDGIQNTISFGDNVEIIGENKQSFYVKGNNIIIRIDSNCVIRDTSFFISGDDNNICISEKGSSMSVEFHVEGNKNVICVGAGTTMHGRGARTIHIAVDEGTRVDIGKDCMFSNDIQIRTSDSHSIIDLEGKRLNYAKDIIIGNHCWIGLGCILTKGTKLSDCTVLGAGSVCTREFEQQCVSIAGNPAKIIKSEINWDRKILS